MAPRVNLSKQRIFHMNVRLKMFKYCFSNIGAIYVECQLTKKFSDEMLGFFPSILPPSNILERGGVVFLATFSQWKLDKYTSCIWLKNSLICVVGHFLCSAAEKGNKSDFVLIRKYVI